VEEESEERDEDRPTQEAWSIIPPVGPREETLSVGGIDVHATRRCARSS
jgi:hypothetical protein